MILPVVLYGCETWPLTLREESRLRVTENRVLRKIFGNIRMQGQQGRKNCIMRSFIIYTLHRILLKYSNRGGEKLAGHVQRM
jgi:hypothetical protein